MNRYQFEDLISDYLENKLSIPKRKEFECDKNIPIPNIVPKNNKTPFEIKKKWYTYYEHEIKDSFNVFVNISRYNGINIIKDNETFNVFIDYLYKKVKPMTFHQNQDKIYS